MIKKGTPVQDPPKRGRLKSQQRKELMKIGPEAYAEKYHYKPQGLGALKRVYKKMIEKKAGEIKSAREVLQQTEPDVIDRPQITEVELADPELEAMRKCVATINLLPDTMAQRGVAAYIFERFSRSSYAQTAQE